MYKGFKVSWQIAIITAATVLLSSILTVIPFFAEYDLMMATGSVMLIIPILYGMRYLKNKSGVKEIFPFKKISPILIPVMILLPFCMQVYVTSVTMPVNILFERLFGMAEESVTPAKNTREFVMQMLSIAAFPAVFEELLCRGVIMRLLKPYGIVPMLFVSSLIFATLHFDISGFIVLFMLGILIGSVRLMTDSLSGCMLMHFSNNLIALLMVNFETGDFIKGIMAILCLLVFPILAVILIKKNYKNILKLTGMPKMKVEFSFEMIIALTLFCVLALSLAILT